MKNVLFNKSLLQVEALEEFVYLLSFMIKIDTELPSII